LYCPGESLSVREAFLFCTLLQPVSVLLGCCSQTPKGNTQKMLGAFNLERRVYFRDLSILYVCRCIKICVYPFSIIKGRSVDITL
jgi:hypothetical protein